MRGTNGWVESLPLTNMRGTNGWVESLYPSLKGGGYFSTIDFLQRSFCGIRLWLKQDFIL